MNKFLAFLMALSLAVFTVGCQSETGETDLDPGAGTQPGVQEPGEGGTDLDPGAGTEPGVQEPGEGEVDLDPGAGTEPGVEEPGENQ